MRKLKMNCILLALALVFLGPVAFMAAEGRWVVYWGFIVGWVLALIGVAMERTIDNKDPQIRKAAHMSGGCND